MSKKFRLLTILVLMTGLLGGLMASSTVSADPIQGTRIQVPRIDMGDIFGTGAWATKLQIQNVGSGPTWAAVCYWGAYSDECPPNDPGKLSTWHKQRIPANGVWTLTPPAGARSAIVWSLASEPASCPGVTTTADRGQPLAMTVDRWGPDVDSYQLSSSYVGISEEMEGADSRYFEPYVMYNYLNKLDTVITIQNSGDICTSVWIWYKEQGNCEYQVTQHITELAPGEAIRVGPPAAVTAGWADVAFTSLLVPHPGTGWLGSAYISANAPLGIIVDQLTLTTPANNQAVLLTFRGQPYKPMTTGEWGTEWYADLLYREISGWDSSIQVQNLTQQSLPTFVTVDFMNESGDEILFVGDWICRNGAVTFYLPAITDLGVNHPFGYVGAAEIASLQQVDYPGEHHDKGEPIFVLVDIKKRKLVDPATGLVRPTVAGENQGGAYNAHPQEEKEWAWGWAMPFVAKQGNGVTSKIALRNNSNCNKFYGKIWVYDETGTAVGVIHTPWLFPKNLKIFDLAYQGFLYPGFVGAAKFEVLGVEQLCDADNDGHVDNLPFMPSIVVMNYGWEAELGIAPPATDLGDLTRIYEAIPYAKGDRFCSADLLGIVTDNNLETVIKDATVTLAPEAWYDPETDTWSIASAKTGPGGMYEIEDIVTYGWSNVNENGETCYKATASKTGFLCQEQDVCLACGEDEVLDFALICNTNTWNGTVKQYVATPDNGAPPIEGATVTATWTDIDGDRPCDDGVTITTTNAVGYFHFTQELPKDVPIKITITKDGYDKKEFTNTFTSPTCGQTYVVTYTNRTDANDYIGLNCYAEVKGQVWNDTIVNGTRDPGEPLLPGETCTLYTDGALKILAQKETDENGLCVFKVGEDLFPGDFTFGAAGDLELGVGAMIKGVDNINPCEVRVVDFPL
jgi:hypothetical protein